MKIDKYRVIVIPAIEMSLEDATFEFDTIAELKAASTSMAKLLLFLQDGIHVMKDYSNCFEYEGLIDGEWIDIEDEL